MARLIVETRDRGAGHIGPGEVIDVLADGSDLGVKVEANIASGKWLLIETPDVAVERLAHLASPSDRAKRGSRLDIATMRALPRWPDRMREADVSDHATDKAR